MLYAPMLGGVCRVDAVGKPRRAPRRGASNLPNMTHRVTTGTHAEEARSPSCGGQLCGASSGRHAGNLVPVGGALYMHGAGHGSGSAVYFGSGPSGYDTMYPGCPLCGHARGAQAARLWRAALLAPLP